MGGRSNEETESPRVQPTSVVEVDGLDKEEDLEQKVSMAPSDVQYKLYKMRFAGCFALCVLNIIAAINWILFSAIAIDTATHFEISLTQVNWLANIVCGIYLFVAPNVPWIVRTFNLRGASIAAAVLLVVGSWIRYGATAGSLRSESSGSYALLFVGSVLVGCGQCIVQIIPPTFSETWFGLKSRTTVTMLAAVANPFGGALSQLLGPGIVGNPGDLPTLMLIVAIITSVGALFAFLVLPRPRTPPTRSAAGRTSRQSGMLHATAVLLGFKTGKMSPRQRFDFFIVALNFTCLVAFFDAFLTLTNQIFEPEGYSSDMAGYIGAAVIVSGLLAAIVSAPLFDRYFQYHLAKAAKCLVPICALSLLVLIWVVRPNNLGGIFFVAVVMGTSAFTILPVALELAAELSWEDCTPTVSSALLYMFANGFSVVTVVGMNALRAGQDGQPPGNMTKALIFEGVFAIVTSATIFALQGEQARKRADALYGFESR